ncbi:MULTISPECIES: glutamine-synthetase adenylyltransferase [unclassified Leisingera]|uniref:[protein-PII] uridylyltransferase family protein n=1 Tax=unclassified Leisingera TaxID=2614906 RepID=UPI0003183967|nr:MULTISPECIES: glutamine-synthetase adenylyltransferase [unclassified Leisingera]KIC26461.1 glutamate-ammonia-ligase adenylyltransferase [Leisingera sp. ANG-S3]KIC52780.1 glutamate-ammonia-ligase adenylyltransferase [Leisingera sp. ANG-S]KID10177.1 glutamate-ammonia-ligase adenylyltransferase [Leisingera sp. ANG1]
MTTELTISRIPRPYDPELGAEARALVPALSGDLADLVAGACGSSPYLKELTDREAGWLPQALHDPEAAVQQVFADCRALEAAQLKPGLRQAKRRLALLTALCDLSGGWSLEQVTGALTDFGALCADVAIKAEIANLIRRKKLPGLTQDDVETAGGMSILAMGKMGAHELNYSSDIDLICLFDETRFDPDDFYEARQGMVRATKNMCAALSDRTGDGYVFRTDLRLRPDPAVTPVCLAMEAAERYYESLGRTWERAAYIKARPCAGDIAAGERFLNTLRPFVWRRHLDFAAIQDAHDIRLRIRENKGTGGALNVPGHDMKLGRGGIREIEFFTQTRQLIAGGRDEDLRLRGTVEGLAALAGKGWVPQDAAETLSAHYRAHREVEHRIQMVHDAQTHKMPKSEDGIARIACLMDLDPAQLQAEIRTRLEEVHELTEGFFSPGAAPRPVALPEDTAELDGAVIARWPTYPALRSSRGARIFESLKPELLARVAKTAKPAETLLALDGFLAGLPAGVQLFSLFGANPQLIDLLIDIAGTSSDLAAFLSRNSGVFDAVIGGSFFDPWPGATTLRAELRTRLQQEDDYEARLDATRRWCKEWHFRIGVHHLRGLIDGHQAGAQYAELAEVVIAGIAPEVLAHFSKKHGPQPGRGAAVLAMGSMGAGQINSQSDLDLIVIYDPQGVEMSDGKRPLATRPYFARLTQAFVTALSAPMAQGRLYEVDMRLRPSGTQGPVAVSFAGFTQYQQNEAWVWEHLALTRARTIAGDSTLTAEIEAFRTDFLSEPRDSGKVLREVAQMRERLAAAKTPAGVWDAKNGPGRMMDIELLSQAGTLTSASAARDVASGLQGAVAAGWLNDADAEYLTDGYRLFWSVQCAARLLSGKAIDAETMGEGGAQFLCRTTGFDHLEALEQELQDRYSRCAALIGKTLEREAADEEGQH